MTKRPYELPPGRALCTATMPPQKQCLGRVPQRAPGPQAFFDLINTSPYGEELAGFFNAFPNIPDPVSLGTANFSGGTYNRGPAFNGSAQFVTFAARVFSYAPCFFQVRGRGLASTA